MQQPTILRAHNSRRTHSTATSTALVWLVLVIVAGGVLLRALRLNWQPLWWDEGYSIYFAGEPLGRMAWLTAHDIHPPLYYALLHLWTGVFGSLAPTGARLLSVFFGALALPLQYVLAREMFGGKARPALLALLLLTFSPVHLYYSQEVRMYGLATALGLAASLALWRWMRAADSGRRGWGPALAYLLAGLAALYTLYYAALLLAGHALWAAVHLRKRLRSLGTLAGVYALMFLLYLPWLLYAVPQLVGYVGGKVQSDADPPLGPLAYVERHLVAFTAGHVQLSSLPAEWLALAPATVAICAIILGLVLGRTLRPETGMRSGGGSARRDSEVIPAGPHAPTASTASAASTALAALAALWTWLLVPVLLGWLINLRLPFFPAGGERLLLITLPYFLLLLALGLDRTWDVLHLGKLAAAALAINALLGIAAFYTTPRYADEDYRAPLQLVQQGGRSEDTLLAIFPWQVGYWRAYDPYDQPAPPRGPQPLLLGDGAVEWSPAVQEAIDGALARGTLWFPEPLTFGSSLPQEIEQYLGEHAVNLENRWYGGTRLTAWAQLPAPTPGPVGANFGRVRLDAAGISSAAVQSANQPLAMTLVWLPPTADSPSTAVQDLSSPSGPQALQPPAVGVREPGGDDLNVSLRLQDASGHVWASREYARGLPDPIPGAPVTETVGLIVPYGLPPDLYQIAVSVQTAAGEPLTIRGSNAAAAVVGEVEITAPEPESGSPVQLPIQHPLQRPAASEGLALLGYSGPGAETQADPLLAGTELGVTLFFYNRAGDGADRQIYLSLLDSSGAGVAGYEGWPLPSYPTSALSEGAAVQVPVAFYLPGSLPSGQYRLAAGFLDPAGGSKTPPVELAALSVQQRVGSFTRPSPSHPFADPPQLGTHAHLLGYDLAETADGQTEVTLYWEVLQPLLPPHHIFVHLDAADGQTVTQQDGPPVTAAGPAPTGSWQPGEFLATVHRLGASPAPGTALRVGLYDPVTQVRLPVTVNGAPAGDSVPLE